MGQALIRNLDDAILEDYREAARKNGRSLEAELRDALARARPMSVERHQSLMDRLAKIRRMTPADVRQTPSEDIVRELRGRDD